MKVVSLEDAEFWADTPRGVNEAGWFVEVDDGFYSGPFASREEAERSIEKISCGDVDDLPLMEAERRLPPRCPSLQHTDHRPTCPWARPYLPSRDPSACGCP